jgi:hypothetical protein
VCQSQYSAAVDSLVIGTRIIRSHFGDAICGATSNRQGLGATKMKVAWAVPRGGAVRLSVPFAQLVDGEVEIVFFADVGELVGDPRDWHPVAVDAVGAGERSFGRRCVRRVWTPQSEPFWVKS